MAKPSRMSGAARVGLEPAQDRAAHPGYGLPSSIRVFLIDPVDNAAPWAAIFPQQLLRRGLAALRDLLERREIARLIGTVRVKILAPCETGPGELQRFARKRAHIAAANGGREGEPRHVIAQSLA